MTDWRLSLTEKRMLFFYFLRTINMNSPTSEAYLHIQNSPEYFCWFFNMIIHILRYQLWIDSNIYRKYRTANQIVTSGSPRSVLIYLSHSVTHTPFSSMLAARICWHTNSLSHAYIEHMNTTEHIRGAYTSRNHTLHQIVSTLSCQFTVKCLLSSSVYCALSHHIHINRHFFYCCCCSINGFDNKQTVVTACRTNFWTKPNCVSAIIAIIYVQLWILCTHTHTVHVPKKKNLVWLLQFGERSPPSFCLQCTILELKSTSRIKC